jgi:phosphoribosyl 1,2-cyclic phosphate phosphodiesterase
MKITLLGTGTSQGVPIIGCKCEVCQSVNPFDKRLRSSVMIEVEDKIIVIDSGPDFRQQMLRAGVEHLDALLFTHEHKDHIAGLDDIRGFNFIQKKAIDVYASTQVQEAIKREFPYIFASIKYPGIPEINLITIDKSPFKIQGLTIHPVEVMHMKLPVLGFRIGDFSYITDANYMDASEKEKIKGSKILVLNALRREKHVSHYNLEEALELIKELQPETAYLTHISHQLGLHSIVEMELPNNVHLGYDGLELCIPSSNLFG